MTPTEQAAEIIDQMAKEQNWPWQHTLVMRFLFVENLGNSELLSKLCLARRIREIETKAHKSRSDAVGALLLTDILKDNLSEERPSLGTSLYGEDFQEAVKFSEDMVKRSHDPTTSRLYFESAYLMNKTKQAPLTNMLFHTYKKCSRCGRYRIFSEDYKEPIPVCRDCSPRKE
jgi:hypothetical protein